MLEIYRRTGAVPILDHAERIALAVKLTYRLAVGGLRLLAPLLSRGSSKVARGLAGRRHAHEVLEAWGAGVRDPERPVLWFHAPSVGEGLQAEAVMAEVRLHRPDVQLVYTFFSPSAEELASSLDVEVATYLPWDLPGVVNPVLDAIRPDALVFTKTEVWPVLAGSAAERGAAIAIVGASVPDGAGRLKPRARSFLRGTWQRVTTACANTTEDADRLVELGVPEGGVEVTGDPGVDSALSRYDAFDPDAPWLTPFRGHDGGTVVAGSTWPSDDDVLLPALDRVRGEHPGMRTIIAPHEPDDRTIATLRARMEGMGWSVATLGEVEATGSVGDHDAIVVDRVGVLATLYSVADVSYVGGGFHDRGLHSVLEPAAAASPVVFGPLHDNARAAAELLAADGAKIARNTDELGRIIADLLGAPADRERIGGNARGYVDLHRGAAERSAASVVDLISSQADIHETEET